MRVCVCVRVGIRLLKIFTWKFSELQILELDAKPKPWIFDAHHRNNKQITLQRWKNQSNNNNNSKNNPKTRNHLSMRNARRKYYSLTFQIVLCARCSMCASPLGWTMVLFFSFSFSLAPKIRERKKLPECTLVFIDMQYVHCARWDCYIVYFFSVCFLSSRCCTHRSIYEASACMLFYYACVFGFV